MKYSIYLAIITLFISSCGRNNSPVMISSEKGTAESVYLTHDHNDQPVVVWTEKDNNGLTLYFAISTDEGKSFSEKTNIPLSPDVATHPESMPKVAFRKDGTIIAAYEKKAPTKANKYASAIFYTMSDDGGNSWTGEAFLHSDTAAGKSRSYFDIERIAMLWEENTENNAQPKTVIYYRIVKDGIDLVTNALTPEDANAFLPVITPTTDGFLTGYLMEQNNHVAVYVKAI